MSYLLKLISESSKTAKELESLTDSSLPTIYRNLQSLVEAGLIYKQGDTYRSYRELPSSEQIKDDMEIIYQQKLMDRNFRKLNIYQKSNSVLEWYMDYQLKGKVTDYNWDKLMDIIHKGWNTFMITNKLDYEKDKV